MTDKSTVNIPLLLAVSLRVITKKPARFSNAKFTNLTNETALLASRENKLAVAMKDFETKAGRL